MVTQKLKFVLAALLIISSSPALAYHDKFDALLKDYVKPVTKNDINYNGVSYDAWAKDERHKEVLDEILAINPANLETKDEKLAFWINAYNLLTIDLITREGERESIKELGGLITSPWDKYDWPIAGKDYTLNDIEHEIIRKLGEPRIHFAINCAAKSCPDLRTESYRADKLEAQLAEQTKLTFANETKGFKKGSDNSVKITKVMDWFGEDFDDGDLNKWLQPYFPDVVKKDTDINFFSYDWSLNKQ